MKLLVIGAGIRTPLLLHGLIKRQTALGLSEITLYDADSDRLHTMGAFARHVAAQGGASFTVSAEPDLATAAKGASFVFCAIRVGQERHRIADERIPLQYGVLGQETTGPGGFAMALRTIPVLLNYAKILEAVAPDAWFVNFTNPAGLITRALTQQTGLRVVGICDTPTAMRRSVATFLGHPESDLLIDYAGLNHLGWIRRVLHQGIDVLPTLIDRYDDLAAQDHEWALFDPGLVRGLGMLPNEYLYYYYSRDTAVSNILASGGTRGEQILTINEPLWQALSTHIANGNPDAAVRAYEEKMLARSSSYMARESGREDGDGWGATGASAASMLEDEGYAGLALSVMEAAVRKQKTTLVLNVPNRGAIADLAPDDVVEVTCLVDEHGPTPLAQMPLEDSIRPLVLAVNTYERLTVEAALTGSIETAISALVAHPLVGSYTLAQTIVADYLDAHREFLPQFGASASTTPSR